MVAGSDDDNNDYYDNNDDYYDNENNLSSTITTSVAEFIKKRLPQNGVIITCGLPATGKTTVAKLIVELKPEFKLLRTDLIRLELFGKSAPIFDPKWASNFDMRERVYEKMFAKARIYLAEGKNVVLDATFVTHQLRASACELAEVYNKPFIIAETCCPTEVALQRLVTRYDKFSSDITTMTATTEYESNALVPEAYFNNLRRFEPVRIDLLRSDYPELPLLLYFTINTTEADSSLWQVVRVVED